MSGLYGPSERSDKVAEFDLTLERPGKWILEGYTLPFGLTYGRQAYAMDYAHHRAADCGTIIVRPSRQRSCHAGCLLTDV